MQSENGDRSGKAGYSPVVPLTAVLDALLVRTSPQSRRCSASDELSQQRYGQYLHRRTQIIKHEQARGKLLLL